MISSTVQLALQGILTGILVVGAGAGLVSLATANGVDVNVVVVEPTPTPAALAEGEIPEGEMPPGAADTQASATTPHPTPVDTPPATSVSRSYYNEVAPDLSLIVVSLNRIQTLLESVEPEDIAWQTEVRDVLGLMDVGYQRLLQVEPSEESAAIHQTLLSTVSRCRGVLVPLEGDLKEIPESGYDLVAELLDACTAETVTVLHQLAE